MHLLNNALIYLAHVLNKKQLGRARKQPLNLIASLTHIARSEFLSRAPSLECERRPHPFASERYACRVDIVPFTGPVSERSRFLDDLLNAPLDVVFKNVYSYRRGCRDPSGARKRVHVVYRNKGGPYELPRDLEDHHRCTRALWVCRGRVFGELFFASSARKYCS